MKHLPISTFRAIEMTCHFPPRLMQVKAAAYYLGVSPSKLRTPGLPCKRDGGNVLYDRVDLDAYADALTYDDRGSGRHTCDAVFV